MREYSVPLTEAEIAAAADPLFERGMPQPEPKPERKLDTPQLSMADIETRLDVERQLLLDVMGLTLGQIQQRFRRRLKRLEDKLNHLEQALEVERQINERLTSQVEQYRPHRVNGNGHAA